MGALGGRHRGTRRVPVFDEARAEKMFFKRNLLDQGRPPSLPLRCSAASFVLLTVPDIGLACTIMQAAWYGASVELMSSCVQPPIKTRFNSWPARRTS